MDLDQHSHPQPWKEEAGCILSSDLGEKDQAGCLRGLRSCKVFPCSLFVLDLEKFTRSLSRSYSSSSKWESVAFEDR